MKNDQPVPTSRTYIHAGCGSGTVVNGHDFEILSNPFAFSSGTMCCACNKGVSLKEVFWADTGETIADCRRRHRRESPPALKVAGWLFPFIFGLIGALIGYLIQPDKPGGAAGGFVGGLLLCIAFLTPMISKYGFKTDYRTFE